VKFFDQMYVLSLFFSPIYLLFIYAVISKVIISFSFLLFLLYICTFIYPLALLNNLWALACWAGAASAN